MATHKHLLIVLLISIVVGTLAGAGALQYAQLVAYSGANPNTEDEGMPNPRQVDYYRSWRSIERSLRLGVPAEMPGAKEAKPLPNETN